MYLRGLGGSSTLLDNSRSDGLFFRVNPILKIILFVLLVFLIFSRLGILLHIFLFLLVNGLLVGSGLFRFLYRRLLKFYIFVYLFLFFINWIFNKNPGFWDQSYLGSKYSDFSSKFMGIFKKWPFHAGSFHTSSDFHLTSSSSSSSSESIQVGWFAGGELLKGCKKGSSCKCPGSSSDGGILTASTLDELKKACGCCVNSTSKNGCSSTSCCTNGVCTSTYPDIHRVKSFLVSTSSGNKTVGFFPRWYTLTLLQVLLSLNMTNKLVMILTLSCILSYTTNLNAFTFAFGELIKPLSALKVPVKEITLIISLALRFIPSLLTESTRIIKAQSSRGIDFKNGSLKDKVVAFLSLFIPLFTISMIKSKELSNAMITRSYYPRESRTRFRHYPLNYMHLIAFSFLFSSITFCFYFVYSSYFWSASGMVDPLLLVVI